MEIPIWKILFSTAVVLVMRFCLQLYVSLVIKPRKICKVLRQQGINGPPPRPLLGNALELMKAQDAARNATVNHPHDPVIQDNSAYFSLLGQWRQQYGPVYMLSLGKMQVLCLASPEMVKQLTTSTSLDWEMPSFVPKDFGPLFGQGILASTGTIWARQRKIMAPEFFMDKIKGIRDIITECALAVVNSWKSKVEIEEGGIVDITVDDDLKRFSGNIIAKACFSSNYFKAQEIYDKLDALEALVSKKVALLGIPGLRYIPTKTNREIWALDKEVRRLILKVVRERQQAGYEKDFLQMLLEGAKNSYSSSDAIDQFIVDNCRNIYLAGTKTTAVSASWCLMLLASHPEWQTRLRNEVQEVCQGQIPDMDMLRKMKQLNMVIQETMRLYPPNPLAREASKDMKLGNILVPKGIILWIMVASMHTDTAMWGSDALEFNPRRFENGIAGACKNPTSYMPFGFGQRICLGQHLAMVELKLLMALILTNFSFTLSPKYVHSPLATTIVQPKHGVNLLIKKL